MLVCRLQRRISIWCIIGLQMEDELVVFELSMFCVTVKGTMWTGYFGATSCLTHVGELLVANVDIDPLA